LFFIIIPPFYLEPGTLREPGTFFLSYYKTYTIGFESFMGNFSKNFKSLNKCPKNDKIVMIFAKRIFWK